MAFKGLTFGMTCLTSGKHVVYRSFLQCCSTSCTLESHQLVELEYVLSPGYGLQKSLGSCQGNFLLILIFNQDQGQMKSMVV